MRGNANGAARGRSDDGDARQGALRPMHISLRAGERLFLNGAVLRADKKVTLELLNDATFLLENHVLQVEDTHTPMRQLYFAAQAMLMDPQNAPASRALFEAMAKDMAGVLQSPPLLHGLQEAVDQVAAQRPFHALKTLRGLFADEARLLEAQASQQTSAGGPSHAVPANCEREASGRPPLAAANGLPDPIAIKRGRSRSPSRPLPARN